MLHRSYKVSKPVPVKRIICDGKEKHFVRRETESFSGVREFGEFLETVPDQLKFENKGIETKITYLISKSSEENFHLILYNLDMINVIQNFDNIIIDGSLNAIDICVHNVEKFLTLLVKIKHKVSKYNINMMKRISNVTKFHY